MVVVVCCCPKRHLIKASASVFFIGLVMSPECHVDGGKPLHQGWVGVEDGGVDGIHIERTLGIMMEEGVGGGGGLGWGGRGGWD